MYNTQYQLEREKQELERQEMLRAQKQQEEEHRLKLRDEKLRQALRESSTEIRDLQHKLRLAYIGKDHVAQMKELEAKQKKAQVWWWLYVKVYNTEMFRLMNCSTMSTWSSSWMKIKK